MVNFESRSTKDDIQQNNIEYIHSGGYYVQTRTGARKEIVDSNNVKCIENQYMMIVLS